MIPVRLPSPPATPSSYSFSVTITMLLPAAPPPVGSESVAPVSLVPTQTLATHCGVVQTVRVIVPPGATMRFFRSRAS